VQQEDSGLSEIHCRFCGSRPRDTVSVTSQQIGDWRQPAANNDTQYLGMTRPIDHRALMSVWGYSAFAVRYAPSFVAISLIETPTYGS
jgi:hypothetical protein